MRGSPRTPLKTAWFHILLALADGAQHGFAIRESVDRRTGGSVKLWPATLYGSIRDLVAVEAIEPLETEDGPDDDQRRRYYRLTSTGRDLLRAEADRLQGLVDAVRGSQTPGRA
jgi:DNA-binding PadR family transcriptional regulator